MITRHTPISAVKWATKSNRIPVYLYRRLAIDGIETVADLLRVSEDELMRTPWLGRKAVDTVIKTLRRDGLALRGQSVAAKLGRPKLPPGKAKLHAIGLKTTAANYDYVRLLAEQSGHSMARIIEIIIERSRDGDDLFSRIEKLLDDRLGHERRANDFC